MTISADEVVQVSQNTPDKPKPYSPSAQRQQYETRKQEFNTKSIQEKAAVALDLLRHHRQQIRGDSSLEKKIIEVVKDKNPDAVIDYQTEKVLDDVLYGAESESISQPVLPGEDWRDNTWPMDEKFLDSFSENSDRSVHLHYMTAALAEKYLIGNISANYLRKRLKNGAREVVVGKKPHDTVSRPAVAFQNLLRSPSRERNLFLNSVEYMNNIPKDTPPEAKAAIFVAKFVKDFLYTNNHRDIRELGLTIQRYYDRAKDFGVSDQDFIDIINTVGLATHELNQVAANHEKRLNGEPLLKFHDVIQQTDSLNKKFIVTGEVDKAIGSYGVTNTGSAYREEITAREKSKLLLYRAVDGDSSLVAESKQRFIEQQEAMRQNIGFNLEPLIAASWSIRRAQLLVLKNQELQGEHALESINTERIHRTIVPAEFSQEFETDDGRPSILKLARTTERKPLTNLSETIPLTDTQLIHEINTDKPTDTDPRCLELVAKLTAIRQYPMKRGFLARKSDEQKNLEEELKNISTAAVVTTEYNLDKADSCEKAATLMREQVGNAKQAAWQAEVKKLTDQIPTAESVAQAFLQSDVLNPPFRPADKTHETTQIISIGKDSKSAPTKQYIPVAEIDAEALANLTSYYEAYYKARMAKIHLAITERIRKANLHQLVNAGDIENNLKKVDQLVPNNSDVSARLMYNSALRAELLRVFRDTILSEMKKTNCNAITTDIGDMPPYLGRLLGKGLLDQNAKLEKMINAA